MIEIVKICALLFCSTPAQSVPHKKPNQYSYTLDSMVETRKQSLKKNHMINLPTEWARIEKNPEKEPN